MRRSHSARQPLARRLEGQPLFLLLFAALCVSMLVPAGLALAMEEFATARAFFYSALMGTVLAVMIGLARGSSPTEATGRADLFALLALFCAFLLLPLPLAVPFAESLPDTRFLNAYVEMVSSFTTTGMSFYDDPRRLSAPLHLWRAQVAWMGGFLIWVSAAAVMAPLSLGGFEVTAAGRDEGETRMSRFERAGVIRRVLKGAARLGPIYLGLTALLWLALLIAGDSPLTALIHAMSTLSTSGISPVGGPAHSGAGVAGELIIAVFLLFALSRVTFSSDTLTARMGLYRDPEFRMGLALVIAVPVLLFLRHWIAAFEVSSGEDLGLGFGAFWGSAFTVLSFLTTTGWESLHWQTAQSWSGLATPGMVLMGLSMIGGGVATTAGGVKLLRVYALYLQGRREMDRLVHPSSVSGSGKAGRRIRRHGAFQAWVFFMLFAICLAASMTILAAFGISFEEATVLSVAALANAGNLATHGGTEPVALLDLTDGAKLALCAFMILGRLELLAILALFNPDLWRE
ncbi:trk system potassium uptake protein TrkH [Pseudooceanicola antarcticus]|uniref:Potassium transporter TrkH n=1 Tax=Pseudooceanicola antarcticus TaxID=1247613 RepID=A0A285IWL5_9RHOB|nr:potassium transporter TrkG [Pseudooceanicola antarcticus]PJE25914.1 potassium transporter TrkH [Pseudooceanicola antarcticus]SNY52384.1 trk system potassium uptake protein TrkH [Pseudooceanicola antarcticus]